MTVNKPSAEYAETTLHITVDGDPNAVSDVLERVAGFAASTAFEVGVGVRLSSDSAGSIDDEPSYFTRAQLLGFAERDGFTSNASSLAWSRLVQAAVSSSFGPTLRCLPPDAKSGSFVTHLSTDDVSPHVGRFHKLGIGIGETSNRLLTRFFESLVSTSDGV